MRKWMFWAGFLVAFLPACSGSETYRGRWKATDSQGEKFLIDFEAKRFAIKDARGGVTHFDYTQNQVHIENFVETYGIQLGDGRKYQLNFPKRDDESVGFILDANGAPLYTISRKNYLAYEAVYKLK